MITHVVILSWGKKEGDGNNQLKMFTTVLKSHQNAYAPISEAKFYFAAVNDIYSVPKWDVKKLENCLLFNVATKEQSDLPRKPLIEIMGCD